MKMPQFCCLWMMLLVLLLVAAACGGGGEENPFGVKSEVVTAGNVPAAMAFAPDGRLFYAEQLTGDIRIVSADGKLLEEPFAHVDVLLWVEWGLTGLALDPGFASNHYVYAYFTKPVDAARVVAKPNVIRFTDQINRGIDPKVIVDDFPDTVAPHAGINANGKIHFGPDGLLYISVGDYDISEMPYLRT